MLRIIAFILSVLVLGFGFSWLAERPGALQLVWQGQLVEMSLTVAVALFLAVLGIVIGILFVLRALLSSPQRVRRYFRGRRRDRGYQALSAGLIAVEAGNAYEARRMSARAKGFLRPEREPMIRLLEAQTASLEGRHDDARLVYEQMVLDKRTKELGLRGLYGEAMRLGAAEAARHYADEAAMLSPQLPWAAKAALEARCRERDWDGAILMLDKQRIAGVLGRVEAERLKAVLLTAKAGVLLESAPQLARENAQSALKLQRQFVPAVVIAAKAWLREEQSRKAVKLLESAWKHEPHPLIAATYIRGQGADGAVERLKRAEKLAQLQPENVESLLAVAEAALNAREFTKARAKAEAAARLRAQERVFLLLADIEEAETQDQARIRYWLNEAVKAPRDPAWVADGYVSDIWLPFSPITGRLDAFEWKIPFTQLSGPIEEGALAEARAQDMTLSGAGILQNVPPLRGTEVLEEESGAARHQSEKNDPNADVLPDVKSTPTGAGSMPSQRRRRAVQADESPRQTVLEPFFGHAPDDPGVRKEKTTGEHKTRLNL